MENLLVIVIIIVGLATLALFLYFVFYSVRNFIESVYIAIFNKPLYVHLYVWNNELPPGADALLQKQFRFYRRLSARRKKYFRHRVARFIKKYRFAGRDGLHVTEEMKVKIAGTAIMLTFGMRNYLPDVFEVIIIYPSVFESQNGDYHQGEFNPRVKAVVFSWEHFQRGIDFDTSNLNLGLHEFAHILHISSLSNRGGTSGTIYNEMFTRIIQYASVPQNRERIVNAHYFREYAYTNHHEFMAVIFEYFFETPNAFRQKLPELYEMVKRMINYKEG
ncbi:zinc-dependent peptidase [Flavobacterium rhizosphaerae]|uniref:Zinc-dependent peptidase n=1 Tax=Flavobacterium rhizosphaerae TaxID=3163298 RepID=A0ABW8YV66_9FLAO